MRANKSLPPSDLSLEGAIGALFLIAMEEIMQLRTDHSFHIGEQHLRTGKPCQDYALSGQLSDELAFAIVSDGCSSGGMTDIGSRLSCLATKQALLESVENETQEEEVVVKARDKNTELFRVALGLEHRDMLATNLFAVASTDEVFVHLTGDGVVALQYENELRITEYDWQQNMPFYPAYRAAGEENSFRRAQSDRYEHAMQLRRYSPRTEEQPHRGMYVDHIELERGMHGISNVHTNSSVYGRLLSVGIFSDGVAQVDGIPTDQVVQELMAFKSTNGQFATRRMNRFLTDAKKRGRGPLDDIAMAVINLGRDTET